MEPQQQVSLHGNNAETTQRPRALVRIGAEGFDTRGYVMYLLSERGQFDDNTVCGERAHSC